MGEDDILKISKSIKLLVKMTNMSFMEKNSVDFFGQPNSLGRSMAYSRSGHKTGHLPRKTQSAHQQVESSSREEKSHILHVFYKSSGFGFIKSGKNICCLVTRFKS